MRISNELSSIARTCGEIIYTYILDPLRLRIWRCYEQIRPLFEAATNYTSLRMPPHPTANPYPREYKKCAWPRYLDDSCYIQHPYTDRSNLVPEDKIKQPEPLEHVTPLHVAAFASNITGMTRFLAHGAIVDAQDIRGQTPAYWAAYFGNVQPLILLKIYGANLHHVDKRGKSLMRASVKYDQIDAIDFLVSQGVSIKTRDGRGLSLLQLAAFKGNVRAYEKLVYYGADEQEKDLAGRTCREILELKCREIYCKRFLFSKLFSKPEPQFTLRPHSREQLRSRLTG